MAEKRIHIDSIETESALFGTYDCNLKRIEKMFTVEIISRDSDGGGNVLIISGEDTDKTEKAARALQILAKSARLQRELSLQTVEYVSSMILDGREDELEGYDDDCVCVTVRGKPIKPKTLGQKKYTELIHIRVGP